MYSYEKYEAACYEVKRLYADGEIGRDEARDLLRKERERLLKLCEAECETAEEAQRLFAAYRMTRRQQKAACTDP